MIEVEIYKNDVKVSSGYWLQDNETHPRYKALLDYFIENNLPTGEIDEWDNGEWYADVNGDSYTTKGD